MARKLNEAEVASIRSLVQGGMSHRAVAEFVGCSLGAIHRSIYPTPADRRAKWERIAAENELEASHG